MIGILLSYKTWIGFGVGLLAAGTFALTVHGPAQYRAGGLQKAAELEAATNEAMKELSDEAEKAAFRRRQCVAGGRVYLNATGECVERPAQ